MDVNLYGHWGCTASEYGPIKTASMHGFVEATGDLVELLKLLKAAQEPT